LPEALRLDTYRVSGCQVRVWWVPEIDDGRCRFLTDSDALTLKAMAGLIGDLCTGGTPAEVAAFDFGFLDELGLMRQFAESRAATVRRIVEMTRAFAESRR
jgi:sulfur transfer protein SufE